MTEAYPPVTEPQPDTDDKMDRHVPPGRVVGTLLGGGIVALLASIGLGQFGSRSDALVDVVSHPLWISSRLLTILGILLVGLGLAHTFRAFAARERVIASTGLAALGMGMVLFTVEYAIAGIAAPGLVAFGDLAPPQLTLALEVQRAIGSGLLLLGTAFVGATILFLAVGLHRAEIYHAAVAGLGVLTGVALLAMFAFELFPASPVDVPFGLVALPLLFVWLLVLAVSAVRSKPAASLE